MSQRLWILLFVAQMTPVLLYAQSSGNFTSSLHATRAGKATWYSEENGGFETLTQIPMDSLACNKCHGPTYADGSAIDNETYAPGCNDCHDFGQGTAVLQSTCLGCHSRQAAEVNLSASNAIYTDVHRAREMTCTNCHTTREMHGDGMSYASMRESGVFDASCTNDGCHPASSLADNQAHNQHIDDVYCSACHVQTVSTCLSCHFESEVAGFKRFYNQAPVGGFVMLVRRPDDGKVVTASYQSLTHNGSSFYAIGVFHGHTVSREARACADCHNTAIVNAYQSSGEIPVAKWDHTENKLVHTEGVIPVPPDWQQALKVDFATYTGNVTDPLKPFDPEKWIFQESGADASHMLYAEPLTFEQMDKLAMDVVSVEDNGTPRPDIFELAQNYPNPFNPDTKIEFRLAKTIEVTLKIYNLAGEEIQTLISGHMLGAGTHRYTFRAEGFASGIYIYRLETPEFTRVRKMTLLR
jgi:hypothetical protein